MMKVPLWMRALRWYAFHSPIQRGLYRLALWLYQRCSIPDIEVETLLDGTLQMKLQLKTWVDYNIYCLGLYEAPLARFFIRSLRPDSVVLDIGAYIGQYTLLAAKYASAGRVIALEPHPNFAQGPQVDFIKIDIEGAEYLALQGMRFLLNRDRPVCLVELHGEEGQMAALYLDDVGYVLTDLYSQPVLRPPFPSHIIAWPQDRD